MLIADVMAFLMGKKRFIQQVLKDTIKSSKNQGILSCPISNYPAAVEKTEDFSSVLGDGYRLFFVKDMYFLTLPHVETNEHIIVVQGFSNRTENDKKMGENIVRVDMLKYNLYYRVLGLYSLGQYKEADLIIERNNEYLYSSMMEDIQETVHISGRMTYEHKK